MLLSYSLITNTATQFLCRNLLRNLLGTLHLCDTDSIQFVNQLSSKSKPRFNQQRDLIIPRKQSVVTSPLYGKQLDTIQQLCLAYQQSSKYTCEKGERVIYWEPNNATWHGKKNMNAVELESTRIEKFESKVYIALTCPFAESWMYILYQECLVKRKSFFKGKTVE